MNRIATVTCCERFWKGKSDTMRRIHIDLAAGVDALKPLQAETPGRRGLDPPLDALLPALFERAFKGEL